MRRIISSTSSFRLVLLLAPLLAGPLHAQGMQTRPPQPMRTQLPQPMRTRPPSNPVPRPSNIGGLPTVPIPSTGRRPTLWIPSPATNGSWYWVADAPVLNGGVVVYGNQGNGMTEYTAPRQIWTPTAERPRWVIDTTVVPVQAWRDVIVTDVVCDNYAYCVDRVRRVKARWMNTCACYAFADGWGRVWRVE